MAVLFSALSTREELEIAVADSGAVNGGEEPPKAISSPETSKRDFNVDGKFATGNRVSHGNTRARGIVSLIKAETNDYATLIDNLVKASRGEEVHGKKPSYKDIMDATNSLLDRSIGKPTQQVLHTGDDIAKELLATRQEALRLQKAEAARKAEEHTGVTVATDAFKVSSLQAMRDQALLDKAARSAR